MTDLRVVIMFNIKQQIPDYGPGVLYRKHTLASPRITFSDDEIAIQSDGIDVFYPRQLGGRQLRGAVHEGDRMTFALPSDVLESNKLWEEVPQFVIRYLWVSIRYPLSGEQGVFMADPATDETWLMLHSCLKEGADVAIVARPWDRSSANLGTHV